MTRTIGAKRDTSSLDRQGAEAEALRLPLTLQSPFDPLVGSRTRPTTPGTADQSSQAPSKASRARPPRQTPEH